jgi:hypothetical protein
MSIDGYEADFEQRLEALDRDSRQCAIFAYTQAALDYQANDFEIRDRLNQHAGFWNGVIGALQTSAFIALGRIFDDDRGTHNADELLRFAQNAPGIFSRQALEARKIREGLLPQQAKQYAADRYELSRGGLAQLRGEFQKRQDLYRDKVSPIRHKVFAHAGRLDRTARDALFTALFRRSLEDLVVFTLRLHIALWQLYHNGLEPVLRDAPSNIIEVMKALPQPGMSSWEHLHSAKDTAEFLDWLKQAPFEEK